MSDYFGGTNQLQKIGLLLSALNPQSFQNTMDLAQAGQMMRNQQRVEDQDIAANRLLKIQQVGMTPSLEQEVFGGNQMDKSVTQDLMIRAMGGPAAYFKNRMAMDAEANKITTAPANSGIIQNGRVIGTVPGAPSGPQSSLGKAAADLAAGLIDKPTYDAIVQKENYIAKPQGTTETWNNPVAEVDPDTGKPIQVRYSNLGNRQVITGATPAKQGNSFDRADYWRSQVKPFADSATNARVQASKVGASLALGTGTGHIAAINALQKMIDEGAVVRDQDVALIQSAQSLAGRLGAQMETLKSGKILSPELQEELKGVANSLESAIYQGVNERIGAYEPVMTEEGVKMDSVLPPAMRKMFVPKQAPASAQPPGPAPIGRNGRPMKWVP